MNDEATRKHAEAAAKSAFEGPLAGLVEREHVVKVASWLFADGASLDGNQHGHGRFNHALAAQIIDAAFVAQGR